MNARQLLGLAGAGLIAGCAGPTVITQSLSPLPYQPPAAGPAVATIKGAGSAGNNLFLRNVRAEVYLSGVDGRTVATGPEAWNTELPVTAGQHLIDVSFILDGDPTSSSPPSPFPCSFAPAARMSRSSGSPTSSCIPTGWTCGSPMRSRSSR